MPEYSKLDFSTMKKTVDSIYKKRGIAGFKTLARLNIRFVLSQKDKSQKKEILQILKQEPGRFSNYCNSLEPWYEYFMPENNSYVDPNLKYFVADMLMNVGWFNECKNTKVTHRKDYPLAHYIDFDEPSLLRLNKEWENNFKGLDSLSNKKKAVYNFFKKEYQKFIKNYFDKLPEIPTNLQWESVFHLPKGLNKQEEERILGFLSSLSLNPRRWCTINTSTAKNYIKGDGNGIYILTGECNNQERVAYSAIRINNGELMEITGNTRSREIDPFIAHFILKKIQNLENNNEKISITKKNKFLRKSKNMLKKSAFAHSLLSEIGTYENGEFVCNKYLLNKKKLERIFSNRPNKLLLAFGLKNISSFGYKSSEETKLIQNDLLKVSIALNSILKEGNSDKNNIAQQYLKNELNKALKK